MLDHPSIDRHFASNDSVLAEVIRQVGPCTLRPRRDRFRTLVGSIISQQISTSAARTIRARFEAHLKPAKVSPESVARLTLDELRALGLSRQKASYLLDLAAKCSDGTVRLSRIGRYSDEEIIEELTQVKGIGRWSAQMFLIFGLRRLNVFPADDLGVRTAIRRLYGLDALPSSGESHEIGRRWQPYASIGAWYCWRFLELPPR
ncbi:DNA-3-methyladenine glycosylase family protein [Candidatus Laterigemmans baculatus]|uniref:DNA-3-methyladenine glycosylase family protein n=1 Tax=Candidatus Laterigemmans baculatus TaxID=2770505 RepID=UPI0013D91D89|nr:DNA-3-methyladenine glycosylase [Candidatus Laterigemmans baculatus]